MKKRFLKSALSLLLLAAMLVTAVSCQAENEAEVLSLAKELLSASVGVNEMYMGEGILHDENGRRIGAYYEALPASLEKYGVSSLADIQAAAARVYSSVVCAQLQSSVLTAIQVDGQLVSPKRYYDLEEKDKNLLMVASTYEPLGVGTNGFEDCRVLYARGGRAEISVTVLSYYEDKPVQRTENVILRLVKENGEWRLDDLSLRFYDKTLLED